jgi:lipopolysaccharide transport system permease protein
MREQTMSIARTDPPKLIIRPSKGWVPLNLKALWEYRELLYFLTWRDIKVRYKQTFLGAAWAIIQPVFTMVVFTIFFGRIAKIPSDGVPYPIFSFSGLLIWTYFSAAVNSSSNSLVGSAHLITKVYFPRLIVPLSSALTGLVDYFIAMNILMVMMFCYGFSLGASILVLPLIILFAFLLATGMGLWLSALNVKYRDVRYIIPFFIQLLLFATPVIYPSTILPEKYRWLLMLNPVSGLVEAHRACFLSHQPIPWDSLMISIIVGVAIFIGGLFYFKRMERFFADLA